MSAPPVCISIHELEYLLMLFGSCRRSSHSVFSIVLAGSRSLNIAAAVPTGRGSVMTCRPVRQAGPGPLCEVSWLSPTMAGSPVSRATLAPASVQPSLSLSANALRSPRPVHVGRAPWGPTMSRVAPLLAMGLDICRGHLSQLVSAEIRSCVHAHPCSVSSCTGKALLKSLNIAP